MDKSVGLLCFTDTSDQVEKSCIVCVRTYKAGNEKSVSRCNVSTNAICLFLSKSYPSLSGLFLKEK